MIRHIVFFSAREKRDVETIVKGLRRLGEIPHSTVFEVMQNTKTDPISGEIDVVVYGEFENAEALAAYKAHPIYSETTAVVRPLRELRISADVVSTLS
ncbi:Dabb family protein [Phyllobacterium sp. P5_D12]